MWRYESYCLRLWIAGVLNLYGDIICRWQIEGHNCWRKIQEKSRHEAAMWDSKDANFRQLTRAFKVSNWIGWTLQKKKRVLHWWERLFNKKVFPFLHWLSKDTLQRFERKNVTLEVNKGRFRDLRVCRSCPPSGLNENLFISKTRHDRVGKVIHWELCNKLKFDHTNKWYKHNLESVQENKRHNILQGSCLPTPPLGQDMTQGRFLSGV